MTSTRTRISVGLALAVALGAFGPISRAVSMESRRYVEVFAAGGASNENQAVVVGHGASAQMWRAIDEMTSVQYTIQVEERAIGRATTRTDETRVAGDRFDRANLTRTLCTEDGCETTTWSGFGEVELRANGRRFAGTLLDGEGNACDVVLLWTYTLVMTNAPVRAAGAGTTSCAGDLAWEAHEGRVYPIAARY